MYRMICDTAGCCHLTSATLLQGVADFVADVADGCGILFLWVVDSVGAVDAA